MKKVLIKGICCRGCAKSLEKIFNDIYGIKKVSVSVEDCSVSYEGYVSKRVIRQALENTDFEIEKFMTDSEK